MAGCIAPESCRRFAKTGRGIQASVEAAVTAGLRDADGTRIGTLGRLECIDDWPAVAEILAAATQWLRVAHGRTRVWAPMDVDIWHAYRFMVRGFDEPPFYGEPRNPPRAPEFFHRFGFDVRKTWCSLELRGRDALTVVAAPHETAYRAILAAGYRFTALGQDASAADVADLHATTMAAFTASLGFTRCSLEEYAALFAAYTRVLQPLYVRLLRNGDGAAEGYAIAFGEAARRRAVYHSVGVIPDAQRRGLGRALFYRTVHDLIEAGYTDVVMALLADDSGARGILGDAMRGAQREYALLQLDR